MRFLSRAKNSVSVNIGSAYMQRCKTDIFIIDWCSNLFTDPGNKSYKILTKINQFWPQYANEIQEHHDWLSKGNAKRSKSNEINIMTIDQYNHSIKEKMASNSTIIHIS